MHRWSPLVVALAFLVCPTPVASANANHPPTAAAGLDQSVTAGTTVYLDAGGSTDADGRITATEWSIRAPNGSTLTPSCRECTTPTFTPDATGRWAVTVTVTDDDGATASDTLYVSVAKPRGPDLSIQAPETTTSSTLTPISVEAVADGTELRRVEIFHDDTRVDQFSVTGDEASITTSTIFESTGPAELLAVATDEKGYVTTRTVTVEVVEAPSDDEEANPTSTGGSDGGSADTTGSGGPSLGDSGRCRAVRFDGMIHTPGSCDEDEDEIMHVLDENGNIVGRQLVDTSGDGELTMTVRDPALEQNIDTTVGEHVDRSQYEVDTGSPYVLAVDYEAVQNEVEQSVVEEVTADDDGNNDGSSSPDNRNTEPDTEPSTESTDPNSGGSNSDLPSGSTSSGSPDVNTGTPFSPSDPADRTNPASSFGGDSDGSSNDESDSSPSYSPSDPADRTNPPTSSGGDSSSSGSSNDDSSSTPSGTSDVNVGTTFSPSPSDRSSLPTSFGSSDPSHSSGSSTSYSPSPSDRSSLPI